MVRKLILFMLSICLFGRIGVLCHAVSQEQLTWNFNSSSEISKVENFQHHIVEKGLFEGKTKIDPRLYLKLPDEGITAKEVSFLSIRLYSSEKDTALQIFYSSPNKDWCLGYSQKIETGWKTYHIDLNKVRWSARESSGSGAVKWGGISGVVSVLRIDPGDGENRGIKIDWVQLSNQPFFQRSSLEKYTWNFKTNDAQGWDDPKGLEWEINNGLLCLNIQKSDSHLANNDVNIDPLRAQGIVIKYKASGLPDKTTGQIFYANNKHGFSDKFYWKIPSLVSDNNWHEVFLNREKDFHGNFKDWLSGKINSLRLDIVDQYPGKIQIEYIRMYPPMEKLKLDSVSKIDINSVKRYFISLDSFTSLDGKKYKRNIVLPEGDFSIWARALDDISGKTAAEKISFLGAVKKNPPFSNTGEFKWFLIGKTSGGNISMVLSQSLSIALDSLLICTGKVSPKDKKAIIEPAEKSTVSADIKKNIIKRGKAPYWTGYMIAHSSDAMNKPINTDDSSYYFRRVFTVPDNFETAWVQITVDDYYKLYLNGNKIAENFTPNSWLDPALINISSRLKKGMNVIAVESVNAGGPGGLLFDLTINSTDLSYLKVVSDSSFVCTNRLEEGWTKISFDDGSWVKPKKMSPPPAAPWTKISPYFDKRYQVPTECLSCEYKEVISGAEAQVLKIKLKSQKPVGQDEVLYLRFKHDDVIFEKFEFDLTKNICQKQDDNTFDISVSTKPFYKYYPDMNIELIFGIYGREISMPDNIQRNFVYKNNRSDTENLVSEVKSDNGFPQLYVNGKVIYPLIGNMIHKNSAPAMKEAKVNIQTLWIGGMMDAKEWWLGPNRYNFIEVDKYINEMIEDNPEVLIMPLFWVAPPTWWQTNNLSEISLFDDKSFWPYYRATASFSSEKWKKDASKAIEKFVGHLETSPYRDKIIGYWFTGGVSAEWQGWGCHECHRTDKLMDYSNASINGFCEFLKSKYSTEKQKFSGINIPTKEDRLKSEIGLFRDPKQASLAIDYDQYYSESVSDTIVYFAGVIKNSVNRKKIVGIYGGYTLEYANMNWAYHMSGHNAFRKVLDSKDIDFISAPPTYGVRAIGDSGEWMWAFKSIQNAGKLVFVDDDTRTHMSGPAGHCPTINPSQTTAVLKRNFGRSLCRQSPICIIPLISGLDFSDPCTIKDLKISKKAGEYINLNKSKRNVEIAVVVDEDSVKYLSFDKEQIPSGEIIKYVCWNGSITYPERKVNTLTGDLIYYQRSRIAQVGAPVDYILFSDLLKKDYDYKLYIFLNCFQYDNKTLNAIRKIQSKDVTMMWCYAPGFIHDMKADLNNMKNLTGIEFGMIKDKSSPLTDIVNFTNEFTSGNFNNTSYGAKYSFAPLFYVCDNEAEVLGVYRENKRPSFAVKNVNKSNSIFCGSNKISPDLLLSIAKGAGVHIYSDSLDFIDANEEFLMFHSAQGGQKTISLNKKSDVVDIFEGEVLFKNVDTFSFEIPKERTKVFFVGDSAKFLNFMDYKKLTN
ncbi:MAG: hypothetical protein Q7J67_09920 [bacterium]|nr:hypothetical protein [bacterium]